MSIKDKILIPSFVLIIGTVIATFVIASASYYFGKFRAQNDLNSAFAVDVYPGYYQPIAIRAAPGGVSAMIQEGNINANARLVSGPPKFENYATIFVSNNSNGVIEDIEVRLDCEVPYVSVVHNQGAELSNVSQIAIGDLGPLSRLSLVLLEPNQSKSLRECSIAAFSKIGRAQVKSFTYAIDGPTKDRLTVLLSTGLTSIAFLFSILAIISIRSSRREIRIHSLALEGFIDHLVESRKSKSGDVDIPASVEDSN